MGRLLRTVMDASALCCGSPSWFRDRSWHGRSGEIPGLRWAGWKTLVLLDGRIQGRLYVWVCGNLLGAISPCPFEFAGWSLIIQYVLCVLARRELILWICIWTPFCVTQPGDVLFHRPADSVYTSNVCTLLSVSVHVVTVCWSGKVRRLPRSCWWFQHNKISHKSSCVSF